MHQDHCRTGPSLFKPQARRINLNQRHSASLDPKLFTAHQIL
jgi:hypothetical protein